MTTTGHAEKFHEGFMTDWSAGTGRGDVRFAPIATKFGQHALADKSAEEGVELSKIGVNVRSL